MAQLNFDATQVEPDQGAMTLPAGWYNVAIDESDLKPTKDGTGTYLKLRFNVLDGQYRGRKVFTQLNIRHPNAQTQEIAQRQLSAIGHAVGVLHIQDSNQLHGLPLKIRVKIRPAEGQYDESNDITAYKNINEQVATVGSAPAAAAPAGGFAPPAQAPQGFAPPAQQPPANTGWQAPPAQAPQEQQFQAPQTQAPQQPQWAPPAADPNAGAPAQPWANPAATPQNDPANPFAGQQPPAQPQQQQAPQQPWNGGAAPAQAPQAAPAAGPAAADPAAVAAAQAAPPPWANPQQ